MSKSNRSVFFAVALTVASVSSHAQISDDFSSGDNWAPTVSLLGNGSFVFSGGAANYTVGTATATEFSTSRYTGAIGSYTSDWSVQINVAYASPAGVFDVGVDQFINTGLMITANGTSLGVVSDMPTFDAFLVTANLYQSGADFPRDIRTSVFVANDNGTEGGRYEETTVSGATSYDLIISFDSTTKVLTASYDLDGAGGASPVTMNALGETVDTSTWNMVSGGFDIHLVGNSGYDSEIGSGDGPTLGLGDVSIDNFVGTNLSAVPEPSTYAALFGACALGFAAWRRRQRRAATV